jgi:hypothetical protein
MAGVLQHIGLKRQVTVTVPVEMLQASAHLNQALQADIRLGGQWQLTRRYWGQLSYPRLTLHGPRANRQLCLLTQGRLQAGDGSGQTCLDLEITLGRASEIQLVVVVMIVVVVLGVALRWVGIFLLPIFGVLFYSMAQWHMTYYTAEIRNLLRDLMMGIDPNATPTRHRT